MKPDCNISVYNALVSNKFENSKAGCKIIQFICFWDYIFFLFTYNCNLGIFGVLNSENMNTSGRKKLGFLKKKVISSL